MRPLKLLAFHGGARFDTFAYDVLNGCAAQGDFDNPSRSNPPTNESCHDQMLNGAHREPVAALVDRRDQGHAARDRGDRSHRRTSTSR